MQSELLIIGAGLAGCEAALAAADRQIKVRLVDMKPTQMSPAHEAATLGELVCSNSLRSDAPGSAVGLLKLEMELIGSHFMQAARMHAVGAGKALAVDRHLFSAELDRRVKEHPGITVEARRMDELPSSDLTIIATGPLTADALAARLAQLTGADGLHFYDAIAPIVSAESVDMDHAFWGDRWGEPGVGDYLNCPMDREQWSAFYQALMSAEHVPLKDFESPHFFEGCLPIEVMAGRGEQTLLFGPMKPVGLTDPRTGRRAHAVVQLRKEDAEGRLLNMVGFQTKLTYPAQQQVFRLIPALASCEFARMGSIHRNTFLDAPRALDPYLRLNSAPHLMVAGQLSGVEGYVESAAMGLLCGINAARLLSGQEPVRPPAVTAMGGLLAHLANTETKHFQPSNVNFGLLPPLEGRVPKKQRGMHQARRAVESLLAWLNDLGMQPAMDPPALD